jgi:hypothetical protein
MEEMELPELAVEGLCCELEELMEEHNCRRLWRWNWGRRDCGRFFLCRFFFFRLLGMGLPLWRKLCYGNGCMAAIVTMVVTIVVAVPIGFVF